MRLLLDLDAPMVDPLRLELAVEVVSYQFMKVLPSLAALGLLSAFMPQEVENTVMQSSEPESNRLSLKPTAFKTDAIPTGNPCLGHNLGRAIGVRRLSVGDRM